MKANLSEIYTQSQMQAAGQSQLHWNNLTSKPTTLSGYGITDAATSSHTHTVAILSDTTITSPVTGDLLRWNGSRWINSTLAAAGIQPTGSYAAAVHDHTFASLTAKPTTLSGYGITDASLSSHTHTFASLTSRPTTLSGYGITDASLSTHNHTVASLTDVTITSNTAGELLKWDGTKWINNTLAEAGIQPAGSYSTTSHNHDTVYMKLTGGAISGGITIGTGTTTGLTSMADGALLISNSFGSIEIGPKNASYGHIYTDRPSFYFNKELLVNNKKVYHDGNLNPGTIINSTTQPATGLIDGLMWYNPTKDETQVYFSGAFRAIGGGESYRKTILPATNATVITFSIAQYDKTTDTLLVHMNGIHLYEGDHYIIAAAGTSITLSGFNAGTGAEFQFTVLKKMKPILL